MVPLPPTLILILWCLAVPSGIFLTWKLLSETFSSRVALTTLALVVTGTNLLSLLITGPNLHWVGYACFAGIAWLMHRREGRTSWLVVLVAASVAVILLAHLTGASTGEGRPDGSFPTGPVNLHRALFSSGNGWLVYTPLALSGLAGFRWLEKRRPSLFVPFFLVMAVSLVVAGWNPAWQYPGRLGHPFLASSWAFLALPLGCLAERVARAPVLVRWASAAMVVLLTALNLFQTWQLERGLLVPERTTPAYFRAVFGSASVDDSARRLLLRPSFLALDSIPREPWIVCTKLSLPDAPEAILDSARPFSPGYTGTLGDLGRGDSCWIRVSGTFRIEPGITVTRLALVITCLHQGVPYKYNLTPIDPPAGSAGFTGRIGKEYKLPSDADPADLLQVYFMNPSPAGVFAEIVRVEVCKPGKP